MIMPLLKDHDFQTPIGVCEFKRNGIEVKFSPNQRITRDVFFKMFPGAGVRFIDTKKIAGEDLIFTAFIIEYSLITKEL